MKEDGREVVSVELRREDVRYLIEQELNSGTKQVTRILDAARRALANGVPK